MIENTMNGNTVLYDVKECRWLNVWAKDYDGYTYIFFSCRDIDSEYSKRIYLGYRRKGERSKSQIPRNHNQLPKFWR